VAPIGEKIDTPDLLKDTYVTSDWSAGVSSTFCIATLPDKLGTGLELWAVF